MRNMFANITFLRMRRRLLTLALAALVSCAMAQKRSACEYRMEIPVYIDSIQASLRYPMAWTAVRGDVGFDDWRSKARAKVFECMGPQPPAPDGWNVRVLAEEQRVGYKASKIELSLSRWYRVTAYVLVPDGKGPWPAVNLLHDHGAHLFIGKEKMIRPIAETNDVVEDAEKWVQNLYGGQYLGDFLASHGYVVFSADAPLWGERGRAEGVDRSKYDIIAGNMMMLGQNLCAYMHYDDIRTTEFLASMPSVDSTRIAAAGCSMGAYRAWMLSALSDRVRCAASVCWMTTTAGQLTTRYGRKENGGFANCIPSLRRYLDYPDIASLAAPKPALFIAGSADKLFPVPEVNKAYSVMRKVWEDASASDRLVTVVEAQPHECNLSNQAAILDFLNRYLKR
ncbi:MAG: alpha/beta hydrolase family protein [Prevotella sp.]|nr:alpha/beta hydrolase family protein [Prevotella sp.]